MSGSGDEWYTPVEVAEALREVGHGIIGVDPCGAPAEFDRVKATHTIRRPLDGAVEPWPGSGLVYCNPPYSDVGPWFARCEAEARKRPVVLHVPPRVETKVWWAHFWSTGRGCMVVVKGRIKYHADDGATKQTAKFPTVFLTWDEDVAARLVAALRRQGFESTAVVPFLDLPF